MAPGGTAPVEPGSAGPAATARQGPFLIGLTGPIGCGKSFVAAILGELGGAVIDADALARTATAPGEPALRAIRERFGAGVLEPSGALDRGALAEIVFADPAALGDLEAIVHPHVRQSVEAALAAAAREGVPFCVLEAIKLVEGGLAARCDEVWLVACDPDRQRERLTARGMGVADIERRMAAQGPDLAERLAAAATRRIDTDGSREQTRELVLDALAEALAPVLVALPLDALAARGGRPAPGR